MAVAVRGVVSAAMAAAAVIAACAPSGGDAGDSSAVDAASTETFIPGFDSTDAASMALATYLDGVREGGQRPEGSLDVIAGCGGDTAVYHPVEMLAAWEITGRTPRGDTTVMRARAWTVAEEDAMETTPPRYMAVQRTRESEWEWDVVHDGSRWHICNGPRFGFVGADSVTSWRPATASRATARALADSVRIVLSRRTTR
jgi:hypothetical protein